VICLLVLIELVNVMYLICLLVISGVLIVLLFVMMFMILVGRWLKYEAIVRVDSGVSFEGFDMVVLSAVSVGVSFYDSSSSG